MTDFTLYDVDTICRECGTEYQAKAFLPQGTEPRFGLCPPCKDVDDKKMARLKQPPRSLGKPPDEKRETQRRTHQRRWEPPD